MLSLYIHIPFCVSKCPYCAFYSTHYNSAIADRYLAALDIEMKSRISDLQGQQVGCIYIGGGTPSTLQPDQFNRLFDCIDHHVAVEADAEITIEANPNTASPETLALLKSRGVNRLSIGVQSFADPVLVSIGRAHSAGDALAAVHAARAAGFGNIGIDLMYGIPGQNDQHWQSTLETALSLQLEHLSVYSLSLDDGSQLSQDARAGRESLPDDDAVSGMYHTAVESLAAAGYRHYEISNFCIPGRECRHNSHYWDRGEYVGFGSAAWSFIGNNRFATVANVTEYIARMSNGINAVETMEVLDRDQAASEILLLGLRRTAGVDLVKFAQLFGTVTTDEVMKKVRKLDGSGLFKIDHSRLSLTLRGFLLSNDALAAILP